MTNHRFPILTWPDHGLIPKGMTSVPWEVVEPHR